MNTQKVFDLTGKIYGLKDKLTKKVFDSAENIVDNTGKLIDNTGNIEPTEPINPTETVVQPITPPSVSGGKHKKISKKRNCRGGNKTKKHKKRNKKQKQMKTK